MMTKEGSTKIVTFMTPGAGVLMLGCDHISHIVKMHYFFKIFFSTHMRTTDNLHIYSNDDQGRGLPNFMTPRVRVLMLGRGHTSHYSEYILSSTLSIYSTLIASVLRDYDAAFLYHR